MSAEKTRRAALQDGIQSVVNVMMERVLNKVLYDDPFLSDKFKAEKPLYAALVPEEFHCVPMQLGLCPIFMPNG